MKAVVFKGPGKVVIEDRSVPQIQDPTDIIVKVDKASSPVSNTSWYSQTDIPQTALCGR
jgi:threonine dehydrogenase-like Zn-dependent dehydrogenase